MAAHLAEADAKAVDLDDLLALVHARIRVEAVMNKLPLPPDREQDLPRVWLLTGLVLLDVSRRGPVQAGPLVLDCLAEYAAAIWGGAWAEQELIRRGGPSLRAVHLRVGLAGDWLTEDELRAGLAALGVRQREDWGTAFETLSKIPLPVDLKTIFSPAHGFYAIRRQLHDDLVDAARTLTDSPTYECTQCWHQWVGHGKGRRCPKCGASGAMIRSMR